MNELKKQLRVPRTALLALGGLRASLLQRDRRVMERMHAVGCAAGLSIRPQIVRALVSTSWFALAVGAVMGVSAPFIGEGLIGHQLSGEHAQALLVVTAGGVVSSLRSLSRSLQSRHAVLLRLVDLAVARGIAWGHVTVLLPASAAVVSQCLRSRSLLGFLSGGCVVAALLLVTALPNALDGKWGRGHTVLRGLTLGLVAVAVGESARVVAWPPVVGPDGGQGLMTLFLGLIVAVLAAVAGTAAARWANAGTWGLRVERLPSAVGRTIGYVLAVGWVISWALGRSERWSPLAEHLLLACPLIAVLWLRVRAVRLLSPEGLARALLLLRDLGSDGAVVRRYYRATCAAVLLPIWAAGFVLLLLAGNSVAGLLLASLALLEGALSEYVVARATVVLPGDLILELSSLSRAGLPATGCLAVVFTGSGMAGAVPTLGLQSHAAQVVLASLLSTTAGLVVALLTRADSPGWLPALRELVR